MAISLDATSSGRSSGQATTVSHIVGSGADRVLYVLVSTQDSNHANLPITTLTYGGVALTKVRSDEAVGNNRTEIWRLINPTAGTANIVSTATGSIGEHAVLGISLTGVDQTTPTDAQNGTSGNSSGPSTSVTSVTDNAWFLTVASAEATFSSNGTGQTTIATLTDQGYENARGTYEGPITPAGAQTQNFTIGSGQSWAISSVAVRPIVSTDLTINKSESITVSESVKAELQSHITKSESITLTEAVTVDVPITLSRTENVTITESVTILIPELFVQVADNITLSESTTTTTSNLQITVSDTVTVSENTALTSSELHLSVTDAITVTENTKYELESSIVKFESITVSESINLLLPELNLSVQENITITESTTTQTEIKINVSEIITISEATTLFTNILYFAVTDSVTISEQVIFQPEYFKNQPFYFNIGDGLSIMLGNPRLAVWGTNGRSQTPRMGEYGINDELNQVELWNGEFWVYIPLQRLPNFSYAKETITVSENVVIQIV